ncbi:hypothetical protein NUW54_g8060 [Trametes sanguinea]|uniref:Uncharacterized protein n=1 Tax=Trametes sanguinea TaxID=158606 RepID=A0ACC1PHA2_9APHY|nr:hypothetical protein NUW54_g8060 [Trametes sanguinea]
MSEPLAAATPQSVPNPNVSMDDSRAIVLKPQNDSSLSSQKRPLQDETAYDFVNIKSKKFLLNDRPPPIDLSINVRALPQKRRSKRGKSAKRKVNSEVFPWTDIIANVINRHHWTTRLRGSRTSRRHGEAC